MTLNQDVIKEMLSEEMTPGQWYEVKELIKLFEEKFSNFTSWDKEALPSEPHRPRWHRLVTNAVRMSPGRDDYDDNSWVSLRTRKPSRNYQYSISPKDPIEEAILRHMREDDGSGHVYLVTNPAWPDWVKIGMSADIQARIDAYQTYSPAKDYIIADSVVVDDRRFSENLAHRRASDIARNSSGEWFELDLNNAIDILHSLH